MTAKIKNRILVCIMAALLLGLSGWCWLRESDVYSESERRVLADFPELSWNEIFSGSFMADFESYTLDQFPVRDSFRTLKSFAALFGFGQKDNNDLYLADGHISKLEYPLNESMLQHAADRFQYVYDTYLAQSGSSMYFSIVPDKNYFLAEPNGYLSLDYQQLIDSMRDKTGYMEYIDITNLLTLDDYYCTDTHWRQENILDVADALLSAMDAPVTNRGSYRENVLDNPFYGVYCGQIALPTEPDTIRYLTSDVLDACTVTSFDTGMPVSKTIYNMEKAYSADPYEIFLSGADALTVIENPNAATDRELILFRDSFGSSIAPLMVESYAKITVVDLRYVQPSMLGMLIDFHGQDVLFLYSTMLLNNSLAIK